jgi:hypothetical protein
MPASKVVKTIFSQYSDYVLTPRDGTPVIGAAFFMTTKKFGYVMQIEGRPEAYDSHLGEFLEAVGSVHLVQETPSTVAPSQLSYIIANPQRSLFFDLKVPLGYTAKFNGNVYSLKHRYSDSLVLITFNHPSLTYLQADPKRPSTVVEIIPKKLFATMRHCDPAVQLPPITATTVSPGELVGYYQSPSIAFPVPSPHVYNVSIVEHSFGDRYLSMFIGDAESASVVIHMRILRDARPDQAKVAVAERVAHPPADGESFPDSPQLTRDDSGRRVCSFVGVSAVDPKLVIVSDAVEVRLDCWVVMRWVAEGGLPQDLVAYRNDLVMGMIAAL